MFLSSDLLFHLFQNGAETNYGLAKFKGGQDVILKAVNMVGYGDPLHLYKLKVAQKSLACR